MKAAATARRGWARRRSGRPPEAAARRGHNIARLAAIALIALSGLVMLCAAIGLDTAQRSDSRFEAERHAALRATLEALRPAPDNDNRFDAATLNAIASRAGLADLRFDGTLAAADGREIQSYQDEQGRIVGWFSWASDRSLIAAMDRLWGIAGGAGALLFAAAVLALRASGRLAGALRRSTATIQRLTSQDAATGLPNRRVTLQRLEHRLAAHRSEVVAFAILDIDNSSELVDTLGSAGSDAMFAAIAERLKSGLPEGAVIGRFADDEFAVVVTGGDMQLATALGDFIAAALATPIHLDQPWQISATVGTAQAPDDGTTADELHRRASLALRAAKHSGRGAVRRFVPRIHEEHAERRFLLRELEAAIRDDSFTVHYQPVVAAEGGAVLGVEALLRWNHPDRGAIAPSQFIPLAEASGLMNRLGEIVLRRALADGARWPSLFVSVNLSPVQMRSAKLVDVVAGLLAETGMPAGRLVLEITEGILIDNPEETLMRLDALRALGAATALDDFGSGFSSLSYLQRFPFDRLKIDRAFVASLGTMGSTGAIIQAIVTLGHALGMKVLAEGVETNEQRVLLRLAGCDEMQGYLFAKACPAEAIDKLTARAARRADAS